MYWWEIFTENPTILIILTLILVYPLLFMIKVSLSQNNYWKKLNNKQQSYWAIAFFTGVNNGILLFLILMILIIKVFIELLLINNTIISTISSIAIIIGLIILSIYRNKIYIGYFLDVWEKILKYMGVNIYLKEDNKEEF